MVAVWFGSSRVELTKDVRYKICKLPETIRTLGGCDARLFGNGREYRIEIDTSGVMNLTLLSNIGNMKPFMGVTLFYSIIK